MEKSDANAIVDLPPDYIWMEVLMSIQQIILFSMSQERKKKIKNKKNIPYAYLFRISNRMVSDEKEH